MSRGERGAEGGETRMEAATDEAATGGHYTRPLTAPDAATLARALRERARAAGFSLAGITTPDATAHAAFYRAWLERGLHGEMAYLEREDALARRADLRGTLRSVRSVLVVTHDYGNGEANPAAAGGVDRPPATARRDPDGPLAPDPASIGIIARYARGRDYHKVVRNRLLGLLRWLDEQVEGGVVGRAYVDTGPLLERDLARRAGLGWFGRNTMLIHPRKGSYSFIGALLLDIELPADEAFEEDRCGTCRACLDACPTGALLGRDEQSAPVIDARRCISYLTIEHRGAIPRELRSSIGNRVYGCDICQEVCPFNVRFAERTSEPAYAARAPGTPPFGVQPGPAAPTASAPGDAPPPHPGTSAPSLIELLETALDEAAWDSFSRGSAIRRAGRAGFARNVCVGLGNWGSPKAVPVLTRALADPHPLVRGHAAWALGRADAETRRVLESAFALEPDAYVRDELGRALEESRSLK